MTQLHRAVLGTEGAPPLLLAGSLGTTLRMWDGQRQLAERLRLIPLDLRGHGDSPAPPGPYELADLGHDVLELMDALDLEHASFCGISLGGMVGMWLGAHASERIDALVLLCTSAHMPPPSMWQERARTVLEAGTVEVIADQVVERWLTPEFAAPRPDVRAKLRAMLAASPPEGYAHCCGAIERMDLRHELSNIRARTLVISGAGDLATPPAVQAEIASRIPDARHEVIDPGAHVVAVERPAEVNQLILEHLT